MASQGFVGYQIYNLPGGLLVVGSGEIGYLGKSSRADQLDLCYKALEDAEEDDIYMDHKINRGMLGDA